MNGSTTVRGTVSFGDASSGDAYSGAGSSGAASLSAAYSSVAPACTHGTADGYAHGCRTKWACAHHGSDQYLTCTEAAVAVRGDRELGLLPPSVPVPRARAEAAAAVALARAAIAAAQAAHHGTLRGYRDGCRTASCPNTTLGRPTCADARAVYVAGWKQQRLSRAGAIVHGTVNGYLTGCRDPRCPGDSHGVTCGQARSRQRARAARRAGVPARIETVDSTAAARRVRQWQAQGHSLRRIASFTGCGHSTIAALAHSESERSRIHPDTLNRILACPVGV